MLRVDSCTVYRERYDYARILLPASSLEVIKADADLLVDDALMNIKIVEDLGFPFGEDACLFEDDPGCGDNEEAEDHGDLVVNNDVDNLVNEMSEEWMEEDRLQEQRINSQYNNEGGASRSQNKFEDINSIHEQVSSSKIASSCSGVDKVPILQRDPTACDADVGIDWEVIRL